MPDLPRRFSDPLHRTAQQLPNIPTFPIGKGPEVFQGQPGEGFLLGLLATLLSPLFAESYYKWPTPIRKFSKELGVQISYAKSLSSDKGAAEFAKKFRVQDLTVDLRRKPFKRAFPEKFCDRGFSFCMNGVILEGEIALTETDLKASPPDLRTPQLAVIGYSESVSDLYTSELRAASNCLIKRMEEDMMEWEKFIKRYAREYFWRSSITTVHTWYNDQLPKRKKGLLAEWFLPYGSQDNVHLYAKRKQTAYPREPVGMSVQVGMEMC
ncbi:hypothetical protein ACMD2_10460 [Ananas comosus]|uniref:Uncharacterized protein n=1 Tax=Ananas comosus TaxID=4615 RepID=A0A199UP84_ANACO|nr:hypothetical protein ACMD2_10460 [Ananas comosus]